MGNKFAYYLAVHTSNTKPLRVSNETDNETMSSVFQWSCHWPPPASYLCMVFWSVSTLFWQRSSVRLVMFTLMESIHTLSENRGKETAEGKRCGIRKIIIILVTPISILHSVQWLTYIMSLIEHHNRFLGQLFGHQVSYLGVQQVMVAVHHNVGMQDLRGKKTKQQWC